MKVLLLDTLLFLVSQAAATLNAGPSQVEVLQSYGRYLDGDSLLYDEKLALAQQLAHNQQWTEAIELYSALLHDNPKDPDVLLGRGLVYAWQGRFAESEEDLEAVTLGYPDYADAWMALGNLYHWWDKPRQAERTYSKWMVLRPTESAPYLARAKAYRASRRFSEARKDLANARELGADLAAVDRLIRDLDRIPAALPWEPTITLDMQTFSDNRPNWITSNVSVKREFSSGSLVLSLIQTRRFSKSDQAAQLQGYLNLWRRSYANLRLQFASQPRVIPGTDVTAELFQGFGAGWQASGSYRRMSFPDKKVNIYGASLAKYAGEWFLHIRCLIVPGNQESGLFVGGAGRRYLGTADDFVELGAGHGRETDLTSTGPVIYATNVLTLRGQTFINRRLGIALSGNFNQRANFSRRGILLGIITRW